MGRLGSGDPRRARVAPARAVVVAIVVLAVLAGVAALQLTTGRSTAEPARPSPDTAAEAAIVADMDTVLARTLPTAAPETTAAPAAPTTRPVPDPAPALVAAVSKA